MEEHRIVGNLYLVLYVVSRNTCTSSTLFICKVLLTYNEIISIIFIFVTITDTFYARHLNTAIGNCWSLLNWSACNYGYILKLGLLGSIFVLLRFWTLLLKLPILFIFFSELILIYAEISDVTIAAAVGMTLTEPYVKKTSHWKDLEFLSFK